MRTPACSVPVVVRAAYLGVEADSFPKLMGSVVPMACLRIAEDAEDAVR
jgi:hypothetical protein